MLKFLRSGIQIDQSLMEEKKIERIFFYCFTFFKFEFDLFYIIQRILTLPPPTPFNSGKTFMLA